MNILAWNCRGLGNPRAVPVLRELIRASRPDVIFLFKTLVAQSRIDVIKVSLGFDNCIAVDCNGRSGGMCVLWNINFQVSLLSYSQNLIDLDIIDCIKGTWRVTGFYGFPERGRRRDSWNLLRSLATRSSNPWVVIGDFNDLTSQNDKKGLLEHPDWCIHGFWEALSDCNLVNIPMYGFPFTWCRHKGKTNEVWERLDRAVGSHVWMNLFPNAWVENLISPISDHSPILLHTVASSPDRYPSNKFFRFENKWFHESPLADVVMDSWNGASSLNLPDRLSEVAVKLNYWGRNLVANQRKEIKECRQKLSFLREHATPENSFDFDITNRKMISLLVKEEEHWKQRAKLFWLKDGDSNTKFFHAYANGRRKKNFIRRLKNGDRNWVSEPHGLHSVVTNYIINLFSDSNGSAALVTDKMRRCISDRDNCLLDAPFSKEEFKEALFQMHPDKAPGPDGFNPRFFQHFWDSIGDTVFAAGVSWLQNRSFPEGINDTIITLIPKCDDPTTMKDLRPIALCNVVLKIITKVLANRLKKILPRVVSENQSAFIKGRLITDNVLLAFEVLHSMKRNTRKKWGDVALKIDISKAYDRLDWNYIRLILTKMGFSCHWVEMVMLCVTSVRYFVRINNDITGPISPKRGLRQGDPLSPYLFILCMEGLSTLIEDASSKNLISGCRVTRQAPAISHLLFADDALLFCKASIEECTTLKGILATFENDSGLAVNFDKSGIMCSNNLDLDFKKAISHVLGVSKPLNTGKYLGLPSLIGRNKRSIFRHIKDKVWQRLTKWRQKPISSAGRLTLIKVAAQAIPVYFMSVFLLFNTLIQDLHWLLNTFWWSSKRDGARSINWLAWEKLCTPQKLGGFGFRDFTAFNLALLGKQGWRFLSNPDTLVSRVFKAKYYPKGEFFEAKLGHNPSFIWRSIWKSHALLKDGFRWKVGSRDSIRVWKDPWLCDDLNFRVESLPNPNKINLRVCHLFFS